MKFRLKAIKNADSKKAYGENIDSFIFSDSTISKKEDIHNFLDFSFSDSILTQPVLEDNVEFNNIEEVNVEDISNSNEYNEEIDTLSLLDDIDYPTDTDSTKEADDIDSTVGIIVVECKKPKPNILKKIAGKVINGVFTILFAFFLAILINIYVCRPSKVSGDSMVPTLVDNETVYISQLPYVFGDIKFGDIVVIDSNLKANRTFFTSVAETLKYNILTKDLFDYDVDIFWIKRVIGLPGDVIEFKDDSIYRNGFKLTETYINAQEVYSYPNGITVEVKEGYIYVMGDNRNISRDSRQEGQIPIDNVVGKLVFH